MVKGGAHRNAASELPLSKLVVRKTRKSIAIVLDSTKIFGKHELTFSQVLSPAGLPPLFPSKPKEHRKSRIGTCESTQCLNDDFPPSPTATETEAEVETELQLSS